MNLRLLAPLAASAAAALTVFSANDARACGGCFAPPTDSTVVTGHRMALSISTEQTVLWDQIQYAGSPAEFAWVLPVKKGAYIDVSTDAWFEALEAATGVVVQAPPSPCSAPFSLGCGAAQFDSAGAEGSNGGGVEVLHRGTVGPYETVTLATDTPGALNDWLEKANFAVDPATQPVIDAYVAEDFDFIALRLQPGKDVREMKPVRVVTPGASATLPLRMVAVGSGAEVAITLFVIAEGRWAPSNFASTRVPLDLLAWDFTANRSNYGELRASTLRSAAGGSSFITSYAQKGSLLSPVLDPIGFGGSVQYGFGASFNILDTIAQLYLNQGSVNKETGITDGVNGSEMECFERFAGFSLSVAQSSAKVVDPCPADAPPDTCGEVDPNAIDARGFSCGALDDLSVALTGLHPRDVWLTRLETALPLDALSTDLKLAPAESQEPVENRVKAAVAVHAEEFCDSMVPPVVWPRSDANSKSTGAFVAMWLGALALGAAAARRAGRMVRVGRCRSA